LRYLNGYIQQDVFVFVLFSLIFTHGWYFIYN
jgi:hypothetical protein